MADFVLSVGLTIVAVVLSRSVGRKLDSQLIALYGVSKCSGIFLKWIGQAAEKTASVTPSDLKIDIIWEFVQWIFGL